MARLMVRANTKKTHVMINFNNVQNIDTIVGALVNVNGRAYV